MLKITQNLQKAFFFFFNFTSVYQKIIYKFKPLKNEKNVFYSYRNDSF